MESKKDKGSSRNNGGDLLPKKTMEMIERVKEIVKNSSDDEIYDILKECNMNLDDAVQKLLLQDDFLEVKSKRERKKENKEASESHSQYLSTTSSHTLGHDGSTQYYSTDSEASGGKPAYKEENRSNPPSSSLTSASSKEVSQSLSNNPVTQRQIWQRVDVNKSAQPSAGSQSACVGVSSPLTMTDIVKIDEVNDIVSSIPIVSTGMSSLPHDTVASNACENIENPPLRAFLQDDLILELGCSEDPVLDPSSLSNFPTRMAKLHLGSQPDDVHAPDISFGSYRPFASKPSITDLKEVPFSGSASSAGQFITRYSEDYGNNHLEAASSRSLVSRTAGNGTVEHSSSLYSQPDAAHGHQYTSPRPVSTFASRTLRNAAQAYSQQTYSNSLPTNLWASATIQPSRDPEYLSTKKLQPLALSAIHSLPTISILEVLYP